MNYTSTKDRNQNVWRGVTALVFHLFEVPTCVKWDKKGEGGQRYSIKYFADLRGGIFFCRKANFALSSAMSILYPNAQNWKR